MVIFDDIEGPLIYEVDILPQSPKDGDLVNFVIYCIDPSGVSGALLHHSTNGSQWVEEPMIFYSCLCIAGGRWVGVIGPVYLGDDIQVFATASDGSPTRNEASTQTFQIEVSDT
jgi:hypothetical protein